MTTKNESPRFIHVSPVLSVNNLESELEYYVEKLSFEVAWRWGDPLARAGVQRDGLELQLVSDGRFAPPDVSNVYFNVVGVDEYYASCVAAGAEISMALDDRPFGVRDFRVLDTSGNALGFGQALSIGGN